GQLLEPADLELDKATEDQFSTLKEIRERSEADAIQKALAFNDGQIGKAAEMLGVSRPTVYHLLKKYNIQTN
ncbi:MAG: helix-turn-helix domain-containing protein, partial [Pseudomonadota bacterium]